MTTTMQQIQEKTAKYAARREALVGALMALREEQSTLERKHYPRLRRLTVQLREMHAELTSLLQAAPELFVKPRSVIVQGIKVGYQKGKGKIDWEDDARVVKLIRRHFPDQADVLIKTTEKPAKDGLALLAVDELKRLGVTVEDTGDVVFVKPIDTDVDKALKALMKELPEDVEEVTS